MLKFIKWILVITVSMILGGVLNEYYRDPEYITEDKIVEKIVEVPSPPKIQYVNTIKIVKDTIVDSSFTLLGDILPPDQKEYYNIDINHDFKPDSVFQGAKVYCNAAFILLDENKCISPRALKDFSYIKIEPYPYQSKLTIKYEKYPIWKKIMWVGVGSLTTYSSIKMYEKMKK